MTESLETTVARLERLVRGENGYYKGLVQRVPELEQAIEDIRDAVEELKRLEKDRFKHEQMLAQKQERTDAERKKWLIAIAPPLVILAIGQIISFVTDILITFSP
jgi:DNA repair ATPase RecN